MALAIVNGRLTPGESQHEPHLGDVGPGLVGSHKQTGRWNSHAGMGISRASLDDLRNPSQRRHQRFLTQGTIGQLTSQVLRIGADLQQSVP